MKKPVFQRLLLLVLCVLMLTSIALADFMNMLIKQDNSYRSIDGGQLYITVRYEFNPLELPNAASTLQAFDAVYEALHSDPYEYYELNSQPLYVKRERGWLYDDTTDEQTEDHGSISCVQISQNVQEDFGLRLEKGRLLNAGDFVLKRDGTIPILLGAEYNGIFELGDTFIAEYLFSTYSFEVVGFLRSGCQIALSTGSYLLDDCIVMPSFRFEFMPETEEEWVTQKIHCANVISGKLKLQPEDYNEASAYVQSVLDSWEQGHFSWTSSSTVYNISRVGINVTTLLPVFGILSVIFVTALICCYLEIYRISDKGSHIRRRKVWYILETILLAELISIAFVLCVSISVTGMIYISVYSLSASVICFLAGAIIAIVLEKRGYDAT